MFKNSASRRISKRVERSIQLFRILNHTLEYQWRWLKVKCTLKCSEKDLHE